MGVDDRIVFVDHRLAAETHALERAKRHQERTIGTESHDLADHLAAATHQ